MWKLHLLLQTTLRYAPFKTLPCKALNSLEVNSYKKLVPTLKQLSDVENSQALQPKEG